MKVSADWIQYLSRNSILNIYGKGHLYWLPPCGSQHPTIEIRGGEKGRLTILSARGA